MLPFMELPRTENRNPKAGVEPNKPLEAVGMLARILGVEILSAQEVSRRETEDLEVARRVRGRRELGGRLGAQMLRCGAVERWRGRKPFSSGVGRSDEQVQREDDATCAQTL